MVDAPASIVGVDSDFTCLMEYYTRKSARQALVSSPDDEALILAKREKPAVIVLEADRADAVGWDLLQTSKADEFTSQLPALVCSWLDEDASGLADWRSVTCKSPSICRFFERAGGHRARE